MTQRRSHQPHESRQSHRSQQPQSRRQGEHAADLLPTYVNGTLDAASVQRVRAHIALCDTCRAELASWQAVSSSTKLASAAQALPSMKLFDQAWQKIEVLEAENVRQSHVSRRTLQSWLQHLALVFRRQVPLIHKSIWIASALINILMLVLVFISGPDSMRSHLSSVESILTLFTTVATACGIAFIYQAEHDAGYEVMLSSPTSIRIVMICRMFLVIGYNMALAAITSAIVSLLFAGSLWTFIQIWLGPVLLLASISLAISVTLGSVFGVAASLVLEVFQAVDDSFTRAAPFLHFLRLDFWKTTPLTLLIALALLAFAIYYAPRQPRLSQA
jgi:hypothetical protein